MAWDFATEPEFEEQLEWMRGFVRDEIYPLETLKLDEDAFRKATDPLKQEVKARGLWAAHLPPELGGGGFGQVKLGLMHEILGTTPYGPVVFGNNAPDSGNAELLAIGGNEDQKARWMQPLLDGKLRSAFSMTERDTAGSDPTLLKTRAVRDGDEWVINGHKWFTSNGSAADFLIVMAVTNPDVHPYQGSSMIIVPTDTPGVDIVRDVATMEHPDGGGPRFGGHSEIIYRDVRVPVREPRRQRGRRLRAGPAAARPRSHPSLHALARPEPARVRHAVRARRVALHPRLVPRREADDPELGRRLGGRDAGGAADDAASPPGRWTRRAPRRPGSRSP